MKDKIGFVKSLSQLGSCLFVFVCISNDKERASEAKDELMRMLAEDELRDAVLLIFANKQVLTFTRLV